MTIRRVIVINSLKFKWTFIKSKALYISWKTLFHHDSHAHFAWNFLHCNASGQYIFLYYFQHDFQNGNIIIFAIIKNEVNFCTEDTNIMHLKKKIIILPVWNNYDL